jgi:hypothetical protein
MSFQGSGTGSVTYQIANQQTVTNTNCTVEVLEADTASMLTMTVGFGDPVYGQVQIGISLFNYTPSTTMYNSIADLMIGMNTQNPAGGWASNTGSSVDLSVTQSGTNQKNYQGFFNAANLTWIGPQSQNALAIKFSNFSFQVTQTTPPPSSIFRVGSGSGSITYQVDGAASQTQVATATTKQAYFNGALTFILANLTWTDPVLGAMQLILTVIGFTGSGNYSNTGQSQPVGVQVYELEISSTQYWQSVATSTVNFVAYYSEQNYSASLQGSLSGTGLVWPDTSQPNLSLNITALSLTLALQST